MNALLSVKFVIVRALLYAINIFWNFRNLKAALNEFRPDILVYNAGTDVLDSDPLGRMRISEIVRSIFLSLII